VAEIAIDLRSSHRKEANGTHTVIIQISGMPTIEMAQGLADWVRDLVRANAHKIGRLEVPPEKRQ
jgi:hypothetical protein